MRRPGHCPCAAVCATAADICSEGVRAVAAAAGRDRCAGLHGTIKRQLYIASMKL